MTTLAWQKGGVPGGTALALLHSWARDGLVDWQETGWVTGLQAAGCALYVPDLPGHGESADVQVPAGVEPAGWTASVILADMEGLGVQRFAVAGYAGGCLVAAHLAVREPGRVRRLVMVACDDRAGMAHAEEIGAALRDPRARMWNPGAAEAVALARADRRHDLATLADWIERSAWPAAPRLGALRTPTMLAVGAQDDRRERAPRLARLFHDAHLATVPGDHRSCLSAPELIRTVTDFLGRA